MPTGYTAKLVEHGQTFREFSLGCARNFGACVTMRDDSLDEPIPDKFEPSKYYDSELSKQRATLERLENMGHLTRDDFGEKAKAEKLETLRKWHAKDAAENARLEAMEKEVACWVPPSPDHRELKDFMAQQLSISKNDLGYTKREILTAQLKTAADYYKEAVEEARRSIEYTQRELEKELQRVASRNQWIEQLRKSLP